MPIKNFDFPKVTLKQSFAETTPATVSNLSVCCIGPQYKLHKADDEVNAALIDQSTTKYSKESGLTVDALPGQLRINELDTDTKFQHLVVKNGVYSYYTTKTAPTTTENTIVFKEVLVDGNSAIADDGFGTRGVLVGDPIIITGTDNESNTVSNTTTILAIKTGDANTYNTAVVARGALEDIKTITSVTFCEYADATYEQSSSTFSITTNNTTGVGSLTIQGGLKTALNDLNDKEGKLEAGDLYIEYREQVKDYVGKLGSINDASDVTSILGTPCEENPLALCCYFAFASGANHTVYFTTVRSNDLDGYDTALDYTDNYDEIYSIVPATEDETIVKACVQHCISASSDVESGARKVCWYGVTQEDEPVIWTGRVTVHVVDGTYKVEFADNIFVTNPAKDGDIIKLTTGTGATYSIVATNDVDTATLEKGETSWTEGTTLNVQVVRTKPVSTDLIDGIIAKRQARSNSERAMCVWADGALFNGATISNFALAAAAAGMRAGEYCHRPISNLGYDFFSLADNYGFTKSELLQLGANGIWIIANNLDGQPINKRQITTAVANDINRDEESIIANIDSIAMTIIQVGQNLVGCSNISDTLIVMLETQLHSILDAYLKNKSGSIAVGPQLLAYELEKIYQDTVNRDHVYADFTVTPPKPFNQFHMTMRVL